MVASPLSPPVTAASIRKSTFPSWCAEILQSDEGVARNEGKERQLDDFERFVARGRKVIQYLGDAPLIRRFRNAPLDYGCQQLCIVQAQEWHALTQDTAIERR